MQDTIIVVLPYPYSIEDDIDDVPFGDCWHARYQLFFKCHLCPNGRPCDRQSPPIPLFLAGYSTPTIPRKFSKHKVSGFGCAVSTTSDGRSDSNVYEINTWLWNFGRGKFTLGWSDCGLDCNEEETMEKDTRPAETSRRWRADRA